MKSVFILEYKDYDQYDLFGIFTTREKAERVKGEYVTHANIQEVALDKIKLRTFRNGDTAITYIQDINTEYNILKEVDV